MSELKTKQRLFDIDEYRAKVRESLKKLKETQKPGEQSGKGNKTVILEAEKDQIQELITEGYTLKQIADALSNDVFGILPKTITQLIGTRTDRKKPKTRHPRPPAPPTETQPTPAPPTETSVAQNSKQRKKPMTEIDDAE